MEARDKKEYTLHRLKEAYQENKHLTIGRHSLQAYKDLKHKYNEATPQQWERLSAEEVANYDHLRSLLIRAEHLERKSNINTILESEDIDIKLERHRYAPEMNKAHFYKVVNKTIVPLQTIPTPQANTIGEAVEALNNTQLINICLYV